MKAKHPEARALALIRQLARCTDPRKAGSTDQIENELEAFYHFIVDARGIARVAKKKETWVQPEFPG